jgi:hypothetical protein
MIAADVPSHDELRRLEAEPGLNEDEARRQAIADEFRHLLNSAMGHTNGNGEPKSLKARAEKAAREHGEVQIATFEC